MVSFHALSQVIIKKTSHDCFGRSITKMFDAVMNYLFSACKASDTFINNQTIFFEQHECLTFFCIHIMLFTLIVYQILYLLFRLLHLHRSLYDTEKLLHDPIYLIHKPLEQIFSAILETSQKQLLYQIYNKTIAWLLT